MNKALNIEYEVLNIEYKVLNIEYKVLNIEYKVLNIEYKVLNVESEVLNIESKVLNIESKVLNIEYKVLNIEYKVLNIEYKVLNIATNRQRYQNRLCPFPLRDFTEQQVQPGRKRCLMPWVRGCIISAFTRATDYLPADRNLLWQISTAGINGRARGSPTP